MKRQRIKNVKDTIPQEYLNTLVSLSEPQEYLNTLVNLSEEIFHELKNTLGIISGLSQLSMPKVQSEDVLENLKVINEYTFECRDVIDRFYGCINGYGVKDKKDIMLRNILFSVIDMVRYKLNYVNNKGHYISTNLNINVPGNIFGNEYELKQAIVNIVLNAIEAMEDTEDTGGVLDISLQQFKNKIVLTIKDTGIGMEEEVLKNIFKSKFTTKGSNGTGLGLMITKNIIEEHGGEIYVNSEIGKGTKFIISFPIYK